MGFRCDRREALVSMEGMDKMNINWKMITLLIMNAVMWYSVFTNGFWITLLWVLIIACIGGIIIKTKENMI